MEVLVTKARKGTLLGKPWATDESLASLSLTDTVREQKLVLEAGINDVQKVLAKALRPERKLLSAVRISGGRIEEVTHSTQGLIEAATEKDDEPVAAATVSRPFLGCPEPDFIQADVLANEVLRAFLTEHQLADFQRTQCFLAVGADSGHRYQLTSRYNKRELSRRGRILYDLDQKHSVCVHDYDVPASEELLAVLFCLSIPGYESYMCALPEGAVMPIGPARTIRAPARIRRRPLSGDA